jgi:hypothetical protein
MSTTDLATTDAGVIVGVPMMDTAEARQIVKNINRHADAMRRDLLELHDREGWRALGYPSWRDCVQAEFAQSAAYLYRQLAAAKIELAIDSPIGEIPESHLRPLAQLDTPKQQRQAFTRADQLAGAAPRTAKHVQQAVQEIAAPPLPSADQQHKETIEAILKEAEHAGERTGTRLYQQAYDHAREIQDLALHNKMIALIDRATDDPIESAAASDRAAHVAKEARDAGRLERARNLIAAKEYTAARTVLDAIEVSTWERDQLLTTIPAAQGRQIAIACTPADCAALLKEAKAFEQAGLTRQYPAISQALIVIVQGIRQ